MSERAMSGSGMVGRRPRVRAVAVLLALVASLVLVPGPGAGAQSGVPATPSSVSVTRADGTLTASWAAVAGADRYHVTYTTDNGQSWNLAAIDHTDTTITIDADNDATYVVGVRGGNSAAWGGWRDSDASGPYTPPPPGVPASVSVERADGALTASWPAVAHASHYHITYTTDNGQSWSLAAIDHTDTTITIGADNDATYIVGVRAGNSAAWGGWRDSPASGPHTPAMAAPASVAVGMNMGEVSLGRGNHWTVQSLDVGWSAVAGAVGYQVQCANVYANGIWDLGDGDLGDWSTCVDSVSGTSTTLTYSDYFLDREFAYKVRVRAKDSSDVWSAWTESQVAWPVWRVSGPWVIMRGDGSLDLEWHQTGRPIRWGVKYRVYCSTDGSTWTKCADDVDPVAGSTLGSVTVTDLDLDTSGTQAVQNATSYRAEVEAFNDTGTARNSSPHRTFGPLTTPAKLNPVTAARGDGTITVTVHRPSQSWLTNVQVVCTVDGVNIGQCPGSPFTTDLNEAYDDRESFTINVGTANNSKTYILGARGVNALGTGPLSDWLSAPPISSPSQIASITASRGDSTLTVSWTEPTGNYLSYDIECSSDSGATWTATCTRGTGTTTGTTYSETLTGATNATAYLVRARAKNGVGTGTWRQSAAIPPVTLTASNITTSTATLTLTGYTGDWWLKQTAPTEQACGSGESDFSHALSTLTADTSYAYAAYGDSSCSSLIAQSPTFKTLPNAVAAVTDITPTTATLTLANYSGNWRYKYTSPTGGECSSEQTGATADVVGLSGDTQYTFTTYTDAACTTAIATAASFTTLSSGDRAPHEDINGLSSLLPLTAKPLDIWSNGTTMWISVPHDDKLYAYKMSDKSRDATKDIGGVRGSVFWSGFWSYGTTRWVADFAIPPKLYAYKVSDDTRQSTSDVTLHSDNNGPWGIWSDANTIWVSDTTDDKLYAYKMSDKSRDSAKDITASGHDDVSGIWSDGVTMWMTDGGDDKLYAYKMSDKSRDSTKDFSLNAAGNDGALGIWSDGATMWVTDQTDKKVYAYHAFSADLTAIDIGTATATLNLANNPSLWYYKANKSPHNTCSAQGVTGSSADITGLDANTTYIYTAYSDSGCATPVAATAVIEFTTKTGTLSLGSSTVTGQSYSRGTAIATLTLPAATASTGSPTIAYNLTPSLPAGLTFNASNRTITGTPTAGAASTVYTYTATGVGYASDDLAFTISVFAPVALSGVSDTETTATLTIANRNGNWYYQADRGPDSSCKGPVSGATKALTGLTAGVAYTYTAYSDSGCTAALAPAATFTVLQLTAGTPTATTNTLTIVGNTGTWRYKYTSPNGGTCSSPQTGTTVNLTGLTKSTQYTFKAYKDSNCTTVAATASAFTTATPSLSSSQIGHDKATITLTDWAVGTGTGKDGNWYYKADKGPHSACSSAQTGTSVALTELAASETYTYTAYSNNGCSSTIAAASAFTTDAPPGGARDANKDISLHSDNDKARGFWTNGTTLYVVDGTDDKVYAYQWSDKSRDSDKDFDTLIAAGNRSPTDLWSDGTTMWVLDPFDNKIYAYKMSDQSRDAGKDHSVHGYTYRSQGLWSDGITLWVSNYQDDKMYAYQWSDKSRDSDKDYSLADGNGFPRSFWGNGVTMWVVDSEDDKLYAYNMSDQSRDSSKDISLGSGNDRPTGIWSDGETIWVAEDDSDDNKLYAYRAHPALIASSIASTTATVTLSAHTGNWWLKRTSPTDGTCTQGETDFSHALSDLTASTTYTFKAYSASDCNSTSEIESVSFTTTS